MKYIKVKSNQNNRLVSVKSSKSINRNSPYVTKISIKSSSSYDDYDDEIHEISQEFTSENTSINSTRLPAVFKLVNFEPGTINIDYGGGKFDNVADYLTQYDVINLVYDPYNRSKEHNQEVIKTVRNAGGADTATCSNVLNVIKEPEVRLNVLRNIKKLVKPGGKVYITVYEGSGEGNEGPTKSGYQLNRKTSEYLEEIQQVFPNVNKKGKLIQAINASTESNECDNYTNICGGSFRMNSLDEFNDAVVDELSQLYDDTFLIADSWIDGNIIHLEMESSQGYYSYGEITVDLKKFRNPFYIKKYIKPMVNLLQKNGFDEILSGDLVYADECLTYGATAEELQEAMKKYQTKTKELEDQLDTLQEKTKRRFGFKSKKTYASVEIDDNLEDYIQHICGDLNNNIKNILKDSHISSRFDIDPIYAENELVIQISFYNISPDDMYYAFDKLIKFVKYYDPNGTCDMDRSIIYITLDLNYLKSESIDASDELIYM